ncbi:phage head morphogenesis protein [Limnobaculum xujianqingii]|uniref:phage head morphogenesis protein n=1 Tax=Limnobaculum xujianqingii TaxID=2738837 RepID=UPI00112B8D81|nr:phage minor head protein [Limnobaculum xujianqingii]
MAVRGAFNQRFDKQSDYFRQKLAIPSERWDDISREQHDHGVIVAGAMKADLVNDLKKAIQTVIDDGKSIQWFRKNFDQVVEKQGWKGWTGEDSKAGKAWRTEVIYTQNLKSSHAAGRYAQLTDPDVLAERPYWRYVHRSVINPREEHARWHNLVIPADDPFWDEHYPPNGFGCNCIVESCSERDLKKLGKTGPDTAPARKTQLYTDTNTGEQRLVPEGVMPGFDYTPGKSATQNALAANKQKLNTLDSAIARKNVEKLINSDVFLSFYNGRLKGEFPVAIMDSKQMAELAVKSSVLTLSRQTIMKLRTQHPDLSPLDFRQLQTQLDNARWQMTGQGEKQTAVSLAGKLWQIIAKPTAFGIYIDMVQA